MAAARPASLRARRMPANASSIWVASLAPARPRAWARSSAASSSTPHLGQLGRHLDLGLDLLQQGAAHAAEGVAPGLDGVAMPRVAVEPDAPGPAIVVDQAASAASRQAPRVAAAALRPQQQRRVQQVMTIGVDVGRDQQVVAHHSLDRMAPAVELRLDPLDDDPAAGADRLRSRLVSRRAALDRRGADAAAGRQRRDRRVCSAAYEEGVSASSSSVAPHPTRSVPHRRGSGGRDLTPATDAGWAG